MTKKKVTDDQIREMIKKGMSDRKIFNSCSCGAYRLNRLKKGIKMPSNKKSSGKSLEEFKKLYDKDTVIPAKIKNALDSLGESWEDEKDFIRRAVISYQDINTYREEFEKYFVLVGGSAGKRIWAGTVELAEEMRRLV